MKILVAVTQVAALDEDFGLALAAELDVTSARDVAEGGVEELEELRPSCARSSRSSASKRAIC